MLEGSRIYEGVLLKNIHSFQNTFWKKITSICDWQVAFYLFLRCPIPAQLSLVLLFLCVIIEKLAPLRYFNLLNKQRFLSKNINLSKKRVLDVEFVKRLILPKHLLYETIKQKTLITFNVKICRFEIYFGVYNFYAWTQLWQLLRGNCFAGRKFSTFYYTENIIFNLKLFLQPISPCNRFFCSVLEFRKKYIFRPHSAVWILHAFNLSFQRGLIEIM